MTKNKKDDVAFDNFKGFIRKGAREPGRGFIPTGHFALDFAIKYGMDPTVADLSQFPDYDPAVPLGLPRGKLVEFFGAEAGGKSSLAYRVCGFAQKLGFKAVWIDTEHSFQEKLCELNGCDVDLLDYSSLYDSANPDKNFYAEDTLEMIASLCACYQVIVLDSVPNLVPRAVDVDNQHSIAQIPRIMADNVGRIAHYAEKHNALVIFINQIRENLNIKFGSKEESPGGHALKHAYSVRVKITKSKSKESIITRPNKEAEGGEEVLGRYSNVTFAKNRMGPPFVDLTGKDIMLKIPIYYKPNFPDIVEQMFDVGRQLKIIKKRVGTFSWEDGGIKVDGRDSFVTKIKRDKLERRLMDALKKVAAESKVVLPPEIVKADLTLDNDSDNDGDNKQKTQPIPRPRKRVVDKVGT